MFDPLDLIRGHVRRIEAYEPVLPFEARARQLGRSPETMVKLDANENPYGPTPAVLDALGRMEAAHIYPDPESRSLRAALAQHHGLPADSFLAGAGADELIDLVMRLFLDPGDCLLDCPPTFGMYAFDGEINAARVLAVPRRADFSVDVEAVEAAVSAYHPKLVFLASPNNPDGSLLPAEALHRLLALPLVVVLDEAYIEFAGEAHSHIQAVQSADNLIVLRTFSKWAGLAGLRVGYGVFPMNLVPHLLKIKQPYNVSQAASLAARISLAHPDAIRDSVDRIARERDRLLQALREIPFLDPYPSSANFVLCRVTGRDATAVRDRLARQGILVRYFNKPGLRSCIRISAGKPEHTEILLAALAEME